MHVLIPSRGDDESLREEIHRALPDAVTQSQREGLLLLKRAPADPAALPRLVFCRQLLPGATFEAAPSIRAWSDLLQERLLNALPETRPWTLHVGPAFEPLNPDPSRSHAGERRCRLIENALEESLRRRRRRFLQARVRTAAPFTPDHSLAQLLLTSPDQGFLSIAPAPTPWEARGLISAFALGEIPVASDPSAPSRAFAKLVEAGQRLGVAIRPGESCVDLGASPGSWTHVAIRGGARVIAVDRAPLRPDLMRHPRVRFVQGDAFSFRPDAPVDWLLCDVIAAPQRSLELLQRWIRNRLCRAFVVTIKFKGREDYPLLDTLKEALPAACREWILTRLCANKNEACAAGVLSDRADA